MDLETNVKLMIYTKIAQDAKIPDSSSVATDMNLSEEKIREIFQTLAAKRLLVLEPENPSKIRMAPPFSGIETPFRVDISDKSYYANCVWDAFGIAAALHQDAIIFSSDGFTGESLILEVKDNKPTQSSYLAHFAVPAVQWWDDIIYT
ncbi:MAG: hypothetical protein JSV69_10750 [Chloroflexota bacterium]|nr:MAG: hypothetical protein JSV69_10750 [Chloroflexota bacterium]